MTVVGLEERRQLEKLTCDLANKRDRWVFVSRPGLNEILMYRCICALVVYGLLLSLLLTTLSRTSVIAVHHCFVVFVCHCKEWLIALSCLQVDPCGWSQAEAYWGAGSPAASREG